MATAGSGVTTVDGTEFTWTRGDTVAVPAWNTVAHTASHDAVLLEISDEPVLRMLGYFRTELR